MTLDQKVASARPTSARCSRRRNPVVPLLLWLGWLSGCSDSGSGAAKTESAGGTTTAATGGSLSGGASPLAGLGGAVGGATDNAVGGASGIGGASRGGAAGLGGTVGSGGAAGLGGIVGSGGIAGVGGSVEPGGAGGVSGATLGTGGRSESSCIKGVKTDDPCDPTIDAAVCVRSDRSCTCSGTRWTCVPTATGEGGTTGSGGSAGNGTTGGASNGGVGGGSGRGGGGALGGASNTGGSAGGESLGGSGGRTAEIIAATPPMGWNSWNKFACNGLNETVVKAMADAFITSGMKDAGYQYVNLDDCWMDGRDPTTGQIRVNATKFPSGIAALADYIHDKGLKIGLYSTPNTQTCAGIYGGYTGGVGSLGYETNDAQSYASWGIDYLKYDKCRGKLSDFEVMRDALRATGRPIVLSINPGDQGPYCVPTNCSIDLPEIANLWRIEFDISANWDSVIRLIDANKEQYIGAGPGHWNDPDMLEVGNGLNDTEGRAHFSMWAIMAAPLITGNDLSTMSETTREILTNREVIAVNQDPLGEQGRVVATPGSNLEVWSKAMVGTNTRAVALFNRGGESASITVKWSDIGIPAGSATVRDLWAGEDRGDFTDSYTAENVGSHTVVMLKIVSAP